MDSPILLVNRWRCPDGTILQSNHIHDYVSHVCRKTKEYCFVDGGIAYTRTGGPVDNMCVYSTDSHSHIRKHFLWGSYGKNGDEPLKRIPLMDLEDEHIEAILQTQKQLPSFIVKLFNDEIQFRKGSL